MQFLITRDEFRASVANDYIHARLPMHARTIQLTVKNLTVAFEFSGSRIILRSCSSINPDAVWVFWEAYSWISGEIYAGYDLDQALVAVEQHIIIASLSHCDNKHDSIVQK